MNDTERLATLIDVWWEAIGSLTDLLAQLRHDHWTLPTDLPGWDVQAIAAHVAHVESMLVAEPQPDVEIGLPEHVRSSFGRYMESGVVARRSCTPAALIEEIKSCAARRHEELLADPPLDGSLRPARLPPGVDWDLSTLLSNRPIDVWMHEQDVRRAVDRPGNLDSAPADHAITSLARSLPFVVAKRAEAAPGTTVAFDVEGQRFGVRVDGSGRGGPDEVSETPDLTLAMTRAVFAMAVGGRRPVTLGDVTCDGDRELAIRILDCMAITP